ncbi:hypothetical protein J437_LFUL006925, partial [Ladona fulva]
MSALLTSYSRNFPRSAINLTSKLSKNLNPKVTGNSKCFHSQAVQHMTTIFWCDRRKENDRRKVLQEYIIRVQQQPWVVSSRHFRFSSILSEDVKIVNVPQFADSVSEGDVRWEKAVGDHVAEDDVVAEIETDK